MPINLNTIKTCLNKVNSKGASLLRKHTGLDISQASKDGFKLKLSENAKTYDAVRVGRKNNPSEHYTDIFTFRDKNGQIVNRYIKEVDGKNIKETYKGYEDLFPWEKDLDEFGEKIIEIPGKKVRSYTRENGKITQIQEDTFALTDEARPYLTHYQRKITPAPEPYYKRTNRENILLEQRRTGEQPKIIENEYTVDKHNSGYFRLDKTKASTPELEEIAQSSYFLPYISPNTKFAKRMANACIKDARFIADPEISLYKQASNSNGYFSSEGVVNINLKSSKDLARTRESLTETIGHEVGHAKWDEKCMLYDFYKAGCDNGDFLRIYSKNDIADIKRYKYSIDNYIPPYSDPRGYHNQFCERVARAEGKNAVKKYVAFEDTLKEEFPNMHGFQFYQPNHNEDDFQGLFSLLNAWG